jgi:hypothetical protein
MPGAAGSSRMTEDVCKNAVADDAMDFPGCLHILALKIHGASLVVLSDSFALLVLLITTATPYVVRTILPGSIIFYCVY